MRKLLCTICGIQIISSLISLIVFCSSILSIVRINGFYLSLPFLTIFFLSLTFFFIYTNFFLIRNFPKNKKYLEFNIWINFLQMIQISIFGFTYYFAMGFEIVPVFSYSDHVSFLLGYEFFNIRMKVFFQSGMNDINVGLNIIPLIIFILLNFISKKSNHNLNT